MNRLIATGLLIILAGLVSSCSSLRSDAASTLADSKAYLMTYFTGNGQTGLHLAYSLDAYHWEKLQEEPLLQPTVGKAKLMRDPSVVQGPDGTFHMVWTSGWNELGIGYASTKDFKHWTQQRELPVMAHEPTARNTWAPEIIYDSARKHFMIFWASTIPEKFPETQGSSEDNYNHRMYYTTTRDFIDFSPTQLLLDPGYSVIDASFFTLDEQLYLIVKNETRFPPKKYLKIAKADSYTGPFHQWSEPISPKGLWVEGPSTLVNDNEVTIYFDAYIEKYYGAIRSSDLINWQDVSDQMHFPDAGTAKRMRHGTVIEIKASLLEHLLAK